MFVEKVQNYYDKTSDYKRGLINWCSSNNSECTQEIFEILCDKIDKKNKRTFIMNWDGEYDGKKRKLKTITDKDIEYLNSKIDELDGTLLVDIVWRFMEEYKIFV